MRITFSMDGIKNMELLYTYVTERHPELGEGRVERYHGDTYCKNVIAEVLGISTFSGWAEPRYLGSHGRIANETFILSPAAGPKYDISFAINTYHGEATRLEVMITSSGTNTYDDRLESLKIALKNRLLKDWQQCTWLTDEQAAALCKSAYEKAFTVENNLRAFASKVLIHFLGVNWIKRAGLEKEAESVEVLKEKFTQRVPDFDNINTDFLSMTLETLTKVMLEGVIYKEDVVLSRQDFEKVQTLGAKQNILGRSIADYIRKRRTVDRRIWEDLFVPYLDDPNAFKTAIHDFIEGRNHVAHSKVLSQSACQVIFRDFEKMDSLILLADEKFEREETSDEVIHTWEAEREEEEYEQEYCRARLADETGIQILDDHEIGNWFDEVLYSIFDSVYQRYHLDVCYEISDFAVPDEAECIFSISSLAVEDGSAKIDIVADYDIDDDLGGDSICHVSARDGSGEELCKAEVHFHNGDGFEGEVGTMEATDASVFDPSELEEFRRSLFDAIESLNPYPARLEALSYANKCAVQFVSDYPCEQCGKSGISINETFLTIGRCCYCGYENELSECARCGELVSKEFLKYGLCPSCVAYIDKQ